MHYTRKKHMKGGLNPAIARRMVSNNNSPISEELKREQEERKKERAIFWENYHREQKEKRNARFNKLMEENEKICAEESANPKPWWKFWASSKCKTKQYLWEASLNGGGSRKRQTKRQTKRHKKNKSKKSKSIHLY